MVNCRLQRAWTDVQSDALMAHGAFPKPLLDVPADTQACQRDLVDQLGHLRGRTRPGTALMVKYIDSVAGSRDGDDLRWGVESIGAQGAEPGARAELMHLSNCRGH